jgi:hypothetical protein
VQRFADVRISVNATAYLPQVIIQPKITGNKLGVNTIEFQLLSTLTNFEHVFSDDAVPPVVDFLPSENLSTAKCKIQVEWDSKLH